MDKIQVAGAALLVGAVFLGVGIISNPERPEVFFGAMAAAISPEDAEVAGQIYEAAERGQQTVDVIVWFSGIWAPPNAQAFAASHEDLMAFAAPVMAFGAELKDIMPTFGAASMSIPVENIGKIAGLASVDFIDEDLWFQVPASNGLQGLTTDEIATVLDFSSLWDNGWRGENIDIYYLDSGAVPELGLASAVGLQDTDYYDRYGHGGAVGHLLTTMAPDARVHSIKVLDDYGKGRISLILKGLENAIRSEQDPEVINMSLGVQTGILFDSLARASEKLHYRYDVDLFASAGNTGGVELSPAKSISVVSVGALDVNQELTWYSARSFDVVAPGDVVSLWQGSMKHISGTSFSCPITAALWSCYLSGNPDAIGKSTDETKTLLAGSELTAQGFSAPTGDALSGTEPVPEPPLIYQAAPYIAAAVGMAGVGIGLLWWQRRGS